MAPPTLRMARGAALVLALGVSPLAGCGPGPRPHVGTRAPTSSATTAPTTPTSASARSEAEWTTYGGSSSRTSSDSAEAALGTGPTEAWASPRLDGAVYGEPLVFGGEVFVATEHDTVYGLSVADGSIEWSDHLGSPVPSSALPCGDISPSVGITSTMVLDPATRTLFASGALWNGTAVRHALFAIDIATHAVRWSRVLDQKGWDAAAQLQRAALALDAGQVLVGFGGNYGDCGSYRGWLVGVPEDGISAGHAYEVPSANEAAIWEPGGPAVDGSGNVFVSTGNGSAGPGQPFDHGNAVVELTSSLAESSFFAPTQWAQDSARDADLGSTSPVLLESGLVFIVGKEGTGYLLHPGSLGGIGGQAASVPLCNSRGATAASAARLFVVCSDLGMVEQVTVTSTGALARGWTWSSPTGGAGSPTLARDVLWSVDVGSSTLYGIDPSSGATRFRLHLVTGTPSHFVGVSAAEGLLVVAGSRAVEAFH